MKDRIRLYVVLSALGAVLMAFTGCASNRSYLPHIPKDMEVSNLEININSPWGGSTVIKAESYKATGGADR